MWNIGIQKICGIQEEEMYTGINKICGIQKYRRDVECRNIEEMWNIGILKSCENIGIQKRCGIQEYRRDVEYVIGINA